MRIAIRKFVSCTFWFWNYGQNLIKPDRVLSVQSPAHVIGVTLLWKSDHIDQDRNNEFSSLRDFLHKWSSICGYLTFGWTIAQFHEIPIEGSGEKARRLDTKWGNQTDDCGCPEACMVRLNLGCHLHMLSLHFLSICVYQALHSRRLSFHINLINHHITIMILQMSLRLRSKWWRLWSRFSLRLMRCSVVLI